ncbi:TPA: hypothetical protein NJ348_004659 [Vibrio parahaemolyticus]|nr:hypothetical protein [Vibrio parahaemolyticus]EKB1967653.1 hypothetical protein [Vibrio parahaemolyticus]ELA8093863.1 hypothetical protein [Vibrio parahaemolyticus]MBE4111957.1 hypothetical protein [Vibrio parahaemolyticus]MBM4801164.1 hypothetical protein [Vibrio parahaemolyticus]
MSKFVGCLIGFQRWFMESSAGVTCGKGKFIGSSSSLVFRRVEFLGVKAESCAEIHY